MNAAVVSRAMAATGDRFDIGEEIGAAVRRSRVGSGWTQAELARRLGTTQSDISRLETGAREHIDVRLVSAAFELLGIRLALDNVTLGLATRREQHDFVHARCVGYSAGRLRADGWDTGSEVEVGEGRYRGWIDLLGFRPADRALLSVEFKTEIDDLGRIQRTVRWYEREAWTAARRLGWRPREVHSLVLVLCSTENDVRVRLNRPLLDQSFPGRAAAIRPWLATPGESAPTFPGIAMVDPRSRRVDWLRPTASDGRRSAAPYADYRAAAAALRRA